MKNILIIGSLVLALILTACGGIKFAPYPSSQTVTVYAEDTETPSGTQSAGFDPDAMPLSAELELLIGTLKLEGTEFEVGVVQAAELLPLWESMKSLLTSDTAAQEDIDALVGQIQAVMWPEQLQAIEDLQLTFQDLFDIMEELDINIWQGGGQRTPPAGAQPSLGATPEEEFGDEDEQELEPTEQGISPDLTATAQERGDGWADRMRMMYSALLDVLLEYLQTKMDPPD